VNLYFDRLFLDHIKDLDYDLLLVLLLDRLDHLDFYLKKEHYQ
jgi:hypothetical protein